MCFYLFFILLLIASCQVMKIPLKKTQFNMYKVIVHIGGSNSFKEELTLDLTERIIIVYGNAEYQPQKSYTAMPESFDEYNQMFYDSLFFSNNKHIEFRNISIEQRLFTTSGTNGYLGLAYHNNSLLNTVFSTINSKKVFYINANTLELGIGEYPREMQLIQSNMIHRKCTMILKSHSHYACHLHSVHFKNTIKNEYIHYSINTDVTFCTTKNAIYTDDDFANVVYKNYLLEQIKEGTCEEVHSDSGYKFVRCDNNYNYKHDTRLTDITFVVGKFSFRLRRDELFALGSDNKFYFLIVNNPDNSGWFFGYPLFNKYITVFDIDSKLISFVSMSKE